MVGTGVQHQLHANMKAFIPFLLTLTHSCLRRICVILHQTFLLIPHVAEWAKPCSHGWVADRPWRLTLTHILVQRLELPPSLTAVQPAHSSDSHYSSGERWLWDESPLVEANQNQSWPRTICDLTWLSGVATHFVSVTEQHFNTQSW